MQCDSTRRTRLQAMQNLCSVGHNQGEKKIATVCRHFTDVACCSQQAREDRPNLPVAWGTQGPDLPALSMPQTAAHFDDKSGCSAHQRRGSGYVLGEHDFGGRRRQGGGQPAAEVLDLLWGGGRIEVQVGAVVQEPAELTMLSHKPRAPLRSLLSRKMAECT